MANTNETVQMAPEGEATTDERARNASSASQVPAPPYGRRRSSGGVVAIVVLLLLAAVIATAFVLVANRQITMADMRTLLELILGPLFALAGAALGFYFANR
ncbi:MAG TPA: hypothetical protein VHI54_01155 [Actinomycetota bacterium]|nr:hypothetical protein [Actinomycetota bacterium]